MFMTHCVLFWLLGMQNGVRGFMLDMYDFQNDIWLCHSAQGQCYNFTAFVSAWLCSYIQNLLGPFSHMMQHLPLPKFLMSLCVISNLPWMCSKKFDPFWTRIPQKLSLSSLRIMSHPLMASLRFSNLLASASICSQCLGCPRMVEIGLLLMTWHRRINVWLFSPPNLPRKLPRALPTSGHMWLKINVSLILGLNWGKNVFLPFSFFVT